VHAAGSGFRKSPSCTGGRGICGRHHNRPGRLWTPEWNQPERVRRVSGDTEYRTERPRLRQELRLPGRSSKTCGCLLQSAAL